MLVRGFKNSDRNRVATAMEALLPHPYEATVTIEDDRQTLRVLINCPDTDLPVGGATWNYDERAPIEWLQPQSGEIAPIAKDLVKICQDWPSVREAEAQARIKLVDEQDTLALAEAQREQALADTEASKVRAGKESVDAIE